MFLNTWPESWTQIPDDCGAHKTSTASTLFNDDMVDDEMSLASSGSYTSKSAVSLQNLSIARGSTPQVQESLKRLGDWNETVKYSQRCAARQELRRRARTATAQVETFMEKLSSAATDARMDRALPSQYTIHIELNEGQKNEDKEDMDFMSMVSALSVESRNSAQASVLHSSFSGVSSLSGSKYNCASKAHSKGRDPKRKATPKQQLAQRRLSLYFQSRDCFRPSSSIYLDQPAQPKEEPGTVPCSATKVKDKSRMKQRILIYFTVLVLASLACAAQLVN